MPPWNGGPWCQDTLTFTCSAGTASPHPGVGPGVNTLEKEDPTHIHVWSALPVKRIVATRNVNAIPGPSSTRPQGSSRPGAEPIQGSQRSSSPSSPMAAAGLAFSCWKKVLPHGLAPGSSGLLLRVCSPRAGRAVPAAVPGEGSATQSTLEQPRCHVRRGPCWGAALPNKQFPHAHPDMRRESTRAQRRNIDSPHRSTLSGCLVFSRPLAVRSKESSRGAPLYRGASTSSLPQHGSSVLLTCSQNTPCCNQPFFALTIFLQLPGPIAYQLLHRQS